MAKDKVVIARKWDKTGPGEVLVVNDKGRTGSLSMTELAAQLPASQTSTEIESPDTTAKVEAVDGGEVQVTGKLIMQDEIQVTNSSIVMDNTNESVIITNTPYHNVVNNGERSFSVLVGYNVAPNMVPNEAAMEGQSVTAVGTNALENALTVQQVDAFGAATLNQLQDGQYVSVFGYHSGNRLTTANRVSISGPFNLTDSDSVVNAAVNGAYNCEHANGSVIVVSGVNNFTNATDMAKVGGLGANLGNSLIDGDNVWLFGEGIDVPNANLVAYASYHDTAIMDIEKRWLAVGAITSNTDNKPKTVLHVASRKDVQNGLGKYPNMTIGDLNKRNTISCGNFSNSVLGVNGHIMMSTKDNDIVDNALSTDGSVSIGLSNAGDGQFRITKTADGINYTKLATIDNSGDLEIHELGGGIILPSPDGNRWKITVDNMGALISTLHGLITTAYAAGSQAGTWVVSESDVGMFNASNNDTSLLIDGLNNQGLHYNLNRSINNEWIQIDLGSLHQIDSFRWVQSSVGSIGTWQPQTSVDGITWVNRGPQIDLGAGGTNVEHTLNVTTTQYRYFRILGISGVTTSSAWLYELDLKVGQ